MGSIVAIVGRPNVGKSTLFNRLTESRQAIMDDQSGVTRDRIYGQAEWCGVNFAVVDTGGYVVGSEDIFEEAIREQVEHALNEANIIVLVVDCITGLTDLDKDFANIIRKFKKPIFIAANKADEPKKAFQANEFYELGLGEIFPISSANGSGTGDLLDAIIVHIPKPKNDDDLAKLPRISVLGRPNVGKSSFVNLITGQTRSIVTDIAGTTRDAIDTHYKAFGKEFILMDTAGIRRKSRVKEDIEFYSVMRSIRALEDSDVCIVILDATRGIEAQDVSIIGLADRNGKGIVIMVNKWDLIEKDTKTAQKFMETIQERISPMNYIPVVFSSVLTKQRVLTVVEKAVQVYENRIKKVPTSALNDALLPEIEKYPPPAIKGKYIKIKYITQLPNGSRPTFIFFCNLPQYIKESYERYLIKKIREYFDFEGVPIQIFFRKK
jgi:GTP-binding protein